MLELTAPHPSPFKLLEGQLLWVRGDNGAGKSTLLKTVLGLIPQRLGEVLWQEPRPSLFYLGHDLGLQPQMTVLEFCRWHPALPQVPTLEQCRQVIKTLGLLPEAHRLTSQLSRGQQQRLLLACALLSGAQLWVLDEPLTALDLQGRALVLQCLQEHKARGGAALVVSHTALDEVADEVLDVVD